MFRRFVLVAAVSLLYGQCAETVKIVPGYKKMNVEKQKLGIVLLRDNLSIANPEDIADNLGNGEIEEVFCDFLASELKEYAEEDCGFAEVDIVDSCGRSGFAEISKYISTEYLSSDNYMYLRNPARKACLIDSLPYLLILDRISVTREKTTGRIPVVVGTRGMMRLEMIGGSNKLILKGTFIVWDNRAGKITAFGQIDQKTDVCSLITKDTWVAIAESVSSDIFDVQP